MQKGKIPKRSKWKKSLAKKIKYPLDWAIIKKLPPVYETMKYTGPELRYKFVQYLERSDKNWEEICISWFAVYAQTSRAYIYDKKWDSQDVIDTKDAILAIFEFRYEQIGIKSGNFSYIMNNRFKNERESLQKNEDTHKINQDVKDILDSIIYKKPVITDGQQ